MAKSSEESRSTTKHSTKELARSLGLIQKLSSSSKKSGTKPKKQPFDYLVVIDFESTCWKDKKISFAPEIIEFPAVLLHTSTGAIESEFHQYVQPSEHQRLSDFCKELTGITQSQVDDGIPIGTCLMLFNNWLRELSTKKNMRFLSDVLKPTETVEENSKMGVKWCTFMTWSDWDFGICLKNECQRKRHLVPQPLRSWIDLRATYKMFYSRKPNGLAGALKDLGIQFTGRQHSGLDDARNTAHLAWRMIKDGCIMNVSSSIDASVTMLHQIIQNGFKPKQPKEAKRSILKSVRVKDTGETCCENKPSQSISINKTDSLITSCRTVCKMDNSERKTDGVTTQEEEDVMDKIPCTSVESLLSPLVSVTDCTSNVKVSSTRADNTKTLVAPVTFLTGFTSFTNQCCPANASTQDSRSVVREATILKRKSRDVDGPIAAKRGLVKQTLGMTSLSSSSSSFHNGRSAIKTSTSCEFQAKESCLAVVNTLSNNQENMKSNNIGFKRLCKGANVSYLKPKTPRLVDRSNLLFSRPFDVLTNSRVSKTNAKTPVQHTHTRICHENRLQNESKVTQNLDKENRMAVGDDHQVVFKTPKVVNSLERDSIVAMHSVTQYSNLSEKGGVTPKNVKNPNSVTPYSVKGSVTPVSHFSGGTFKTPKAVNSLRRDSLIATHKNHSNVTQCSSSSKKEIITPKNLKSSNSVTPYSIKGSVTSVLRFNGGSVTPPLCECGRRARRLTVGKAGPNQGRVFYACSVRNNRSSFGKSPVKATKKSCKFFCWEPKGIESCSSRQRTLQVTRQPSISQTKTIGLSSINKP